MSACEDIQGKDFSDAVDFAGPTAARAAVDAAPDYAPPPDAEHADTPSFRAGATTPAPDPAAAWRNALATATLPAADLRALVLPERRPMMGDWFCEGDLGFIFAARGVGKTWWGLHLAVTIAEGGRMGEWRAPAAVPVLYVDGEMPPDLLRQREQGLSRSTDGRLFVLSHAVLFERTGRALNIADPVVQAALTAECEAKGVRVMVLDNLSTLASGMKENDADEWEKVNGWLLDLRRRGVSVVIVHHAGRNGAMRGTSRREDAAFWVVSLTGEGATEDGASFTSTFTKRSRNTPHAVPAMAWRYTTEAATGRVNVACRRADPSAVFRRLVGEGVTLNAELAEEMGVKPSTVSKLAAKGIKAGWLTKRGREYELVVGAAEDGAPVEDGNEGGNEEGQNEGASFPR